VVSCRACLFRVWTPGWGRDWLIVGPACQIRAPGFVGAVCTYKRLRAMCCFEFCVCCIAQMLCHRHVVKVVSAFVAISWCAHTLAPICGLTAWLPVASPTRAKCSSVSASVGALRNDLRMVTSPPVLRRHRQYQRSRDVARTGMRVPDLGVQICKFMVRPLQAEHHLACRE